MHLRIIPTKEDQMGISDIVKCSHDLLVIKTANRPNSYRILKDYSGTYIQKQMESEERMIDPIFRVFEAAKPERGRKLNVNPIYEFSIHNDSLFDYASIIGYKLRKPWHLFNRLIAVHIPLCPNDCWHCYVPKELYVTEQASTRHVELTARQIVDAFKKQRKLDKDQGKQSNVLRITGGEPFLVPELILEVLQCIQEDGLSSEVFVWAETNLEPFVGRPGRAFMDNADNVRILNALKDFHNFCVHPCFHGLTAEEFDAITGKNFSISLEEQVAALKRLVTAGIDVYPTFGTNVCDPINVKALYDGIKAASPNLPLKVALVKYDCDYEPVGTRISPETTRKPQLYSRFAALRIWNELLLNDYGIGYGVYPRNLVAYNPPMVTIDSPPATITKEEEIVFFLKSSFRDLYHREILELLAYPSDHIFEITYDKEWVQEDLFFHIGKLCELYKGKKCLWFYVSRNSEILPLRYGHIVEVKNSTGILSFKIKCNDYLSFGSNGRESRKRVNDKVRNALRQYFGSGTVPPRGKYVVLGEDCTGTVGTGGQKGEARLSSAFNVGERPALSSDLIGFHKAVDQLIECEDMRKSLFYRLTLEGLGTDKEDKKKGKTVYTITGGKSFKLLVDYYLPNYREFNEKQPEQRTVVFESSNPKIQIVGSPKFVFSKYGTGEVRFRTDSVTRTEEIAVTIHSPFDEFRAANVTLTIRLEPARAKEALYSLISAALLTVGSTGFTMLSKALEGKKGLLAIVSDYIGQLFTFPSILFVVLLTLCFYGAFYFKSSGVVSTKP